MAAILLLGLISYELLPVAALPNIDTPTVMVTAQLPGADARVAGSRNNAFLGAQGVFLIEAKQAILIRYSSY
jgi:hypothetical protein